MTITGITPILRSVEDLRAGGSPSRSGCKTGGLAAGRQAPLVESGDDVPHLPGRLVGRGETLRRARVLLDDGGRVLLQGFSGMGKSALAATLAADWVDDGKGAVLWLHTGGEKAETTLQALARPLEGYQAVANAAEGTAWRCAALRVHVSFVVLMTGRPALHRGRDAALECW